MNLDLSDLMLDKQFVAGGRGPRDYDCWGICCEVYRRLDKELPDNYPLPVGTDRIDKAVRGEMDNPHFVRLDRPEPPCLVALMVRPPYVSHIGVMISDHEFVHILAKQGVTVAKTTDTFWKKRIYGFYRYEGDPHDA